jgi:uncharacterized repeat protein (TIGR01451 family)
LTDTASVLLQPRTVALTFVSSPAGLRLAVNQAQEAAPFTRTVIVGSLNSVGAPSPQTLGGTSYTFSSWSDGGAASHDITAPPSAATYGATYVPAGIADLAVSMVAAPNPVTVNDLLTYSAMVTNAGPAAAGSVTLSMSLPAGATFVSSNPPAPTCALSGTTLTCSLGTLAAGGSSGVSAVVQPTSSGVATATCSVSAAETDPNTGDNNAAASATVNAQPSISISDATVTEGNAGTTPAVFTVTLSAASSQTVTVAWSIAKGGAAKPGSDYIAASGGLTFTPGTTSQTINVAVIGDTVKEKDETFTVRLSGATSATVGDDRGVGRILNDDN